MDLMEDDPREAELLQEIDELEAELEAALNSPDEPINNDFENEKRQDHLNYLHENIEGLQADLQLKS